MKILNLTMMLCISTMVFVCAAFILERALESPYSNAQLISQLETTAKNNDLGHVFTRLYTRFRPSDSSIIRRFPL